MEARNKEVEFLQKKQEEFNNEPHIEQPSSLAGPSRIPEPRAFEKNSLSKDFFPEDFFRDEFLPEDPRQDDYSSDESYTGKGKGKSRSKR